MEVLPHNFTSSLEVHEIAQMVGYTQCMADILEYLKSKNKILIDTDELKDIIYATNDELLKLKNNDDTLNLLIKSINNNEKL